MLLSTVNVSLSLFSMYGPLASYVCVTYSSVRLSEQ